MKQHSFLRQLLKPLKKTPLHPQWFVFINESKSLHDIAKQSCGLVLDIGSASEIVKTFLNTDCHYISLDYYQTVTKLYFTRPQIFGDGQCLPIKTDSVDTVLLLNVLEHLPRPENCIAEIWRVLRPGGKLIIHVPFLYPLHDEPYDFQRWTHNGLKALADRHSFNLKTETAVGHPVETSALLMNIALSKTVLNWFKKKNPLLSISPLILLIVPLINVFGWVLARLCSQEDFMPYSYHLFLEKKCEHLNMEKMELRII